MAQKTRTQLNTVTTQKVISGGRQTTAQKVRDLVDDLVESLVNAIDDADVAGGYLKINGSGIVNTSFISSLTPAGQFLRDDGTWATATSTITNGLQFLSGDIGLGGILTQHTTFTGAFNINFTINNVGIGTSTPLHPLHVEVTRDEAITQKIKNLSNQGFAAAATEYENNLGNQGGIMMPGEYYGFGWYDNSAIIGDLVVYSENDVVFMPGAFGGLPNAGSEIMRVTTSGATIGANTPNRVLYSDANSYIKSSTVTSTELGYLSGVTSSIQLQINSLLAGLSWKQAVACATTANITLSGEQTIDGVTTNASRVLVKNQSTSTANGIYLSGSGAWTRVTDADTGAELVSATVFVSEGTTNGDTQWTCTNDSITIGVTNIAFAQVSGAGTYAGDGSSITLTGNIFSINTSWIGQVAITTLGTITTGVWNAGAVTSSSNVTATTSFIGPLIYGGTGVGSQLNLKGTSGNGTSTVAAINFLVGNNGATTAGSVYNSGQVNIGNYATPLNQRLVTIGQDTAWVSIGSMGSSTTLPAIYLNQTTLDTTTYALGTTAAGGTVTALNGVSGVRIRLSNTDIIQVNSTNMSFLGNSVATGAVTPYTFTAPNNTNQTLSTAIPKFLITLGSTQWATGALAATQGFFSITQPTISFVGASTATLTATVSIDGAPASGTNAVQTTTVGLLVRAGAVAPTGTATTSYGAYIYAQTGATTNIAIGTDGIIQGQRFLCNGYLADIIRDHTGVGILGNQGVSGNGDLQLASRATSRGITFYLNGTAGTQIWSMAATTGALTAADAINMAFGTTTGTKIGTATTQKIGFWNATPIVQPTTSVTAATLVGGGGANITDTDTFDGYTLKQVVKALRNTGILA